MSSIVIACGGETPDAKSPESAGTSLQLVTPQRNLHLRAAFDSNPNVYVGRFVPAGVSAGDLDENRAVKTVCSKFYTVVETPANVELDELAYASSQAGASVGVVTGGGAANASGSQAKGSVVRVHYKITKKIQVDSDPVGLKDCCAKNPGDCTDQVIGEFLMGSGEIYQDTTSSREGSASLGVPPVAARASASDTSQWKKVQSFQNTYFAFLPMSAGVVNSGKAASSACDFCKKLPEDASGQFFCGVSSPAVEEATGRDNAMQSARAQVVKFLGEKISTKSESLSSSAKGLLSDQRFTEAFAKGIATRVKDKEYCSEQENSPERRSVYKVLAYVSNDSLQEAATKAIDEVAPAAKVDAKDATAAKDAIKKAASK